jgi:hypothetical protein
MSLLEKAKKTAKEFDDQKKKEKDNEEASRKYFKESLEKISKNVLNGLKEFHNVKTKKGTLKLIRKRTTKPTNTIAWLRLVDRPGKQEDLDLLLIDAAIESGERDYADDCRNIPYTEAIVSIYVDNPPTDERFSYAPTYNGRVKGLGLTTFFSVNIRNWDSEETTGTVAEKLEEVAKWIAPLFSEE